MIPNNDLSAAGKQWATYTNEAHRSSQFNWLATETPVFLELQAVINQEIITDKLLLSSKQNNFQQFKLWQHRQLQNTYCFSS
jgi:hypothetical protein